MRLLLLALWAATPFEVDAQLVAPDGGSSVQVGEPFKLRLEARHEPGQVALLPNSLDLGADVAERRTARQHHRRLDKGTEVDVYELELVAFSAGEQIVPKIPLALGSTTAYSAALEFLVATGFSEAEMPVASSTAAEAMAELENMVAPDPDARELRVRDYTVLWVFGASVLALVLLFFGLRYWRQRPEAPAAPPPPPRPAHEAALEAIDDLRGRDLLSTGAYHEHYVELSAILRRWVGARFGFDSIELTIEELQDELDKRPTPGLDRSVFGRLVSSADLVKFAKHEPSLGAGYGDLDRSQELVEAAIARPVEPKQ